MKNRQKLLLILSAVMSLIIIFAIWYFSAQPRGISKDSSEKVAEVIEKAVSVNSNTESETETVQNQEVIKSESKSEDYRKSFFSSVTRKGAHFAEFCALGFFLSIFVHSLKKSVFSPFIVLFAGIIVSISDEIHQFFIPGRGPSVNDILIDSSGILFGLLLSYLCYFIVKKMFSDRQTFRSEK